MDSPQHSDCINSQQTPIGKLKNIIRELLVRQNVNQIIQLDEPINLSSLNTTHLIKFILMKNTPDIQWDNFCYLEKVLAQDLIQQLNFERSNENLITHDFFTHNHHELIKHRHDITSEDLPPNQLCNMLLIQHEHKFSREYVRQPNKNHIEYAYGTDTFQIFDGDNHQCKLSTRFYNRIQCEHKNNGIILTYPNFLYTLEQLKQTDYYQKVLILKIFKKIITKLVKNFHGNVSPQNIIVIRKKFLVGDILDNVGIGDKESPYYPPEIKNETYDNSKIDAYSIGKCLLDVSDICQFSDQQKELIDQLIQPLPENRMSLKKFRLAFF